MVKSNFGDRSQQLEEARTNILVRMDQFKDALGYAIDGCKKFVHLMRRYIIGF